MAKPKSSPGFCGKALPGAHPLSLFSREATDWGLLSPLPGTTGLGATSPELLTLLLHTLWFPARVEDLGEVVPRGSTCTAQNQAKLPELLLPLETWQGKTREERLEAAEVVQEQSISPWGKIMVSEEKSVQPDLVV